MKRRKASDRPPLAAGQRGGQGGPASGRPQCLTRGIRVYQDLANNEQYVDLGIVASRQVSAEVLYQLQGGYGRRTIELPAMALNA